MGERAEDALIRELNEEIGKSTSVNGFVGAVEHSWPEGVRDNHEINLVFSVSIDGISPDDAPVSLEDNLDFIWASQSELVELNLQPIPLIELIERMSVQNHSFWGSTM